MVADEGRYGLPVSSYKYLNEKAALLKKRGLFLFAIRVCGNYCPAVEVLAALAACMRA